MTKNQNTLKVLSTVLLAWHSVTGVISIILLSLVMVFCGMVANNDGLAQKVANALNQGESITFNEDTPKANTPKTEEPNQSKNQNRGFVPENQAYRDDEAQDSEALPFDESDYLPFSDMEDGDVHYNEFKYSDEYSSKDGRKKQVIVEGDAIDQLKSDIDNKTMTSDEIRVVAIAATAIFAVILFMLVVGKIFTIVTCALGIRASKKPEKTGAVFVLAIIGSICCIFKILGYISMGVAGLTAIIPSILFIVFTVYVYLVKREHENGLTNVQPATVNTTVANTATTEVTNVAPEATNETDETEK